MLKVGLVQMSMSSEVSDNLEKAVRMSEEAAAKGAEMICLPELFTTPYFPREEDPEAKRERGAFLSTVPGMVTETLSDLAKRTGTVVIGGSIYEAAEDGLFNTAVVFDSDGRMLGKYRKTHIPHDECFYEQHYFTPGDTGFQVFSTSRGKVSALICYDQWFPEAARCSALIGRISSSIRRPSEPSGHRPGGRGLAAGLGERHARTRHRERGPVCAVNRVGVEGGQRVLRRLLRLRCLRKDPGPSRGPRGGARGGGGHGPFHEGQGRVEVLP